MAENQKREKTGGRTSKRRERVNVSLSPEAIRRIDAAIRIGPAYEGRSDVLEDLVMLFLLANGQTRPIVVQSAGVIPDA